MQYPSRSDYLNAIRYPQFAFQKKHQLGQLKQDLDASLMTGKAVEKVTPMGTKTLWSASGSCAIVFKYQTFSPPKLWAIRCFHRSSFEIIKHYQKALKHLEKSSCQQYFVDCFLLAEGIQVLGKYYPLLKMEWVEGENLKKFLKANLHNTMLLRELAEVFYQLSQNLLNSGIAHGDLQHGNLIIHSQGKHLFIKLIDYDSLYFTKESYQFDDSIKGLFDYQHPLRQFLEKRCLTIDFFPQLVIYLSILSLAENPRLWQMYNIDEREGLLFSGTDFQNPRSSDIFKTLSSLSEPIPTLAHKLKAVCQLQNFETIPSLLQFLSNEPIILSQKITVFNKVQSSLNSVQRLPIKLSYDSLKQIQSLKTQWESQLQQTQHLFEQLHQKSIFPLQTLPHQFSNTSLKQIQSLKTQWESQLQQTQHLFERLHQKSIFPLQTLPHQFSNTSLKQIQSLKTQWESQLQQTQHLFERLEQKIQSFQTISVQFAEEVQQQLQASKSPSRLLEQSPNPSRNVAEKQPFLTVQLQLTQERQAQLKTLKKQLNAPTWTTEEIATTLSCSSNWCYQQLDRFPHQFRGGKEYFKDNKGRIHWTKTGFYLLKKLSYQ